MRSYEELEKLYTEQASKKKLPKAAKAFAKDVFIASQFFEDHKIQFIPRARAEQEAAAALEDYEPEQRAKFESSIEKFFEILSTLQSRF